MIFYKTLNEWNENKHFSPNIVYRGGLFECDPDCYSNPDRCSHIDYSTDENVKNMSLAWDKLNMVWRLTKDIDLTYVYWETLPNINVLIEGYNVDKPLLYSAGDQIFLDGIYVSAAQLIKYPNLRMVIDDEYRRRSASLVDTKDDGDNSYFFMRDSRKQG